MRVLLPLFISCASAATVPELGSHGGFPVERAVAGAPTYTYMSVRDPEALNLDGSIYGEFALVGEFLSRSHRFYLLCRHRRVLVKIVIRKLDLQHRRRGVVSLERARMRAPPPPLFHRRPQVLRRGRVL